MRKLAAVLMVVGLSALPALGLASCGDSEGREGGTLTVSFASYPDALDPQFSYTLEGWSAMYDTYIPLLTYAHAEGEAGSEIVPGLAESLPKITDGGRTYTLKLRKGLKYSDGTPVRASDFKAAVERMFELNSSGSPYYTVIAGAEEFQKTKKGGISGIEVDDETGEIVIRLTSPQGAFDDLLALLFAAPVPAGTPAEPASKTPIPATGPYEIVALKPGRGWSYARNPQWEKNNAALVSEVPDGHVDKIEAKVVSNQSTQVNEVQQGKTDWMYDSVPPDRVAEVKAKYEGSQYRLEPSDRRRLRLDEHDPAALRRPQGAPGGQPRGQPEPARTDLRRRNHRDPPDHPAGRSRSRGVQPLPVRHGESPAAAQRGEPLGPRRHLLDRKPQRRGGRILRIDARRNRLRRGAESRQLGNLFHRDRQREDAGPRPRLRRLRGRLPAPERVLRTAARRGRASCRPTTPTSRAPTTRG